MARMSTYVPDELKARMDAIETVNWSSIAQTAFEREIRLHPKLTESEMQATIERLKASKLGQTDEVIAAGVEAGKKWAMEEAQYLDLKKVGAQLAQSFSIKSLTIDHITNEKTESLREFPLMRGNIKLPEAILEGEYFEHGFCIGVLEVWNQVKDRLS